MNIAFPSRLHARDTVMTTGHKTRALCLVSAMKVDTIIHPRKAKDLEKTGTPLTTTNYDTYKS